MLGRKGWGAVCINLWPLASKSLGLAQHSRSHLHVALPALTAVLAEILNMTKTGLAQPAESCNSEPQATGAGRQGLSPSDLSQGVNGAPVPGAGPTAQKLL